MTPSEFRSQNWDLLEENERAAWLHMFGASNASPFIHGNEVVDDIRPDLAVDANLVCQCESQLGGKVDLYLKNCLSEASVLAYSGMTDEEVQHPDTAQKFYKAVLLLSVNVRAKCLYWTIRGEEV